MVCRPEAGTPHDPGQNGRDTEILCIAKDSGHDGTLESWQHDQEVEDESIQAAIALIHGKWKIGILTRLRHGPLRLSQLCRMLPGASKKMLTQHLREMEKDGLVMRSDRSTKVRHVEYSLSDSPGRPVLRLIDTLAELGRQHKSASSAKKSSTGLPENDERGEICIGNE
jgi:DNA-binding HxlR family transcriptional regulator